MSNWSDLSPDFLSEGAWSIGQGVDAPDRLLFREAIRFLGSLRVLDVGFGSAIDADGVNQDCLNTSFLTYHGIDITPKFVERANKRHPWATFRQGTVETIENGADYDLVWCRHVLEHVDDGQKAFERLWAAASGVLMISWFIRPSWTPSELGCVDANGFHHWTYSAPEWVKMVADAGGKLSRIDFDHHLMRCSVWVVVKDPSLAALQSRLNEFASTPTFVDAVIPRPDRVNEPMEDALDLLQQSEQSFGAVIPVVERADDLVWTCRCALSALQTAEGFMLPTQDEPSTMLPISEIRNAKAQIEGILRGSHNPVLIQEARDAQRRIVDKLREAGRV